MLLQLVDPGIVLNDLVAEIRVAADESLDGVLQLGFGEAAHLGDPVLQPVQLFVVRLDGVLQGHGRLLADLSRSAR